MRPMLSPHSDCDPCATTDRQDTASDQAATIRDDLSRFASALTLRTRELRARWEPRLLARVPDLIDLNARIAEILIDEWSYALRELDTIATGEEL